MTTEVPPELPQDGPALCSLFGNLLDNAVKAVSACPKSSGLSDGWASCRGGYLVVEEENPLPPPLHETAQQSRVRAGRGLGLEILSGIARRYGGEVETTRLVPGCCLTGTGHSAGGRGGGPWINSVRHTVFPAGVQRRPLAVFALAAGPSAGGRTAVSASWPA